MTLDGCFSADAPEQQIYPEVIKPLVDEKKDARIPGNVPGGGSASVEPAPKPSTLAASQIHLGDAQPAR